MAFPPRAVSVAVRSARCALLATALAACAGPRLEVATAPSQPSVTLADAGIRLIILLNTWKGYPGDLGKYYTPVEVRIENDRNDNILVRYGDFLAVDEAQNQYRAVAPAEVSRALFGAQRPPRALRPETAGWAGGRPPVLTAHGPWRPVPFWRYRPWSPFYPFHYPYYPSPYYDPYYYPYGRPWATGYDILTLGLREGRILPGARVEGFLYLQQATKKGNTLTLSWTPAADDGKSFATLSAQFRIVR